eukprot:GHVU01107079.1.p2 GENE.GHVU01107079.1~~GHVU01107079.1.p2  ORF type:complete len:112 (+),score=10.89 GHVU01107079.1:29-337(+)
MANNGGRHRGQSNGVHESGHGSGGAPREAPLRVVAWAAQWHATRGMACHGITWRWHLPTGAMAGQQQSTPTAIVIVGPGDGCDSEAPPEAAVAQGARQTPRR